MATKTGGTKATTSLTVLQWQPGGLNTTDLATINNALRNPIVGAFGNTLATGMGRIEDGFLYFPDRGQNYVMAPMALQPGDWIMVDALGWPTVIPNVIMASVSSSWTHS